MYVAETANGRELCRGSVGSAKRYALKWARRRGAVALVKDENGTIVATFDFS